MTPSFLSSSHGPNINKHRRECVWLQTSLFISGYCTTHTSAFCFIFFLCKTLKTVPYQHISIQVITFINGNIPLYRCLISLTDFLSFVTINYNYNFYLQLFIFLCIYIQIYKYKCNGTCTHSDSVEPI